MIGLLASFHPCRSHTGNRPGDKEAKEQIDSHRIHAGLEQPKPELTPDEQAQKRLYAMVERFGVEQARLGLDAFE